ncbi:Helix-turn-helix domain-containing protein [Rhodospirillales bacterium URHD0017]|nr:Helix-turn-helix domain-containing protein [Rhodospirillales bacterium URHD0017]
MTAAPYSSPVTDTGGAARYVGLSESSLNKKRCDGTGPKYQKIGKAVRYRFCDLDSWLESNTVASTTEAAAPRRRRHSRAR